MINNDIFVMRRLIENSLIFNIENNLEFDMTYRKAPVAAKPSPTTNANISLRHQNGSNSCVFTEYHELDMTPTPRTMYERTRTSSGERCLIYEQISTTM